MAEIEVVYNDGMFGFVEPLELSRLIETGEIVKFLRDDSWVYLGIDPTRSGASKPTVLEKRQGDRHL